MQLLMNIITISNRCNNINNNNNSNKNKNSNNKNNDNKVGYMQTKINFPYKI